MTPCHATPCYSMTLLQPNLFYRLSLLASCRRHLHSPRRNSSPQFSTFHSCAPETLSGSGGTIGSLCELNRNGLFSKPNRTVDCLVRPGLWSRGLSTRPGSREVYRNRRKQYFAQPWSHYLVPKWYKRLVAANPKLRFWLSFGSAFAIVFGPYICMYVYYRFTLSAEDFEAMQRREAELSERRVRTGAGFSILGNQPMFGGTRDETRQSQKEEWDQEQRDFKVYPSEMSPEEREAWSARHKILITTVPCKPLGET